MNDNYKNIISDLGSDRVLVSEPLSKYSHIRIGGPADLFFVAETREDLINAVQSAIRNEVPFTVIGWGSNSLISDKGIRGLVIKNKYKSFEILEELSVPENDTSTSSVTKEDARQETWKEDPNKVYTVDDLDYVESGVGEVLLKVSSGYDLPLLITQTLNQGITGLQWFAGIPGTLAGAVYNNIHGGKKLFGQYVVSATLIDGVNGELKEVDHDYFGFAYDESRMRANKDVLVDVILKLKRGDIERAKFVRNEWMKRKAAAQPQNSLGCTYANPPEEIIKKMGYPTPSVGYFVEHVMGWQDKNIVGGASMGRANGHAAFICNDGDASSEDYIAIMKKVWDSYKKETNFELHPEIFFLGEFENNPFQDKR